jgi:hypothetical protein
MINHQKDGQGEIECMTGLNQGGRMVGDLITWDVEILNSHGDLCSSKDKTPRNIDPDQKDKTSSQDAVNLEEHGIVVNVIGKDPFGDLKKNGANKGPDDGRFVPHTGVGNEFVKEKKDEKDKDKGKENVLKVLDKPQIEDGFEKALLTYFRGKNERQP